MFVLRPRRGGRPRTLVARLDRAAATLNPILTLVAIGLVIIDAIGLCSLLLDEPYANWLWAWSR